jgi:non-specific serine/threonine protein kinase/serine/threonine-protein kinase
MDESPREQKLFDACLDRPVAQQEQYLNEACGGDAELRNRVMRLLAAHAVADKDTLSPVILQSMREQAEIIGPYRVIRVLGEGGMGTVYEADQTEPVRRRVALKFVKSGMHDREVMARFTVERQALAAIDHPYVAKVFDAGQTDTGRPYFVMELVDGVPLLEYCDVNHLSVRKRVELLILICQAVQHAHHKGVLHRDLKPSNVLVGGDLSAAVPKIIDFGIAKAIGLDTSEGMTGHTRADQTLGTAAYMSPEQAGFGQMDVDTRSDVYSLGVILYESLAGCLPVDPRDSGCAIFLARLASGELHPSRPSTRVGSSPDAANAAAARGTMPAALRRELQGDLDWIVMKSLEVDRRHRYETAEALAEDLRRYLKGMPVSAHPPSISYQFRKFVQRHKVQVIAAAIACIALLSGAITAAAGFIRATRAEAVAKQEATASRQVSDFLVQLFTLPSRQESPDKPATVTELLQRGAATIETELKGQPFVQARLYSTMSRVYEALGQYRESKRFAEKSLALPHAPGRDGDLQTASAHLQLGRVEQRLGHMDQARDLLQKALAIRVQILGENHLDVAQAYNYLGSVEGLTEHYDAAVAAHQKALTIQQSIGGAFQPDAARSLRGIALVEDRRGNIEGALDLFRKAEEVNEKNYGPNHPFTASSLQDVAVSLKSLKRYDESRQLLERSLSILKTVYGPDHPQVSFTEHSLGNNLVARGNLKAALPMLQDAYRIRMAAMGPDNPRTADVAESLGTLEVTLGDLKGGTALLEQAFRNHRRAYGPKHFATLETQGNLARSLVLDKRYEEAMPHLTAVVLGNPPPQYRIDLRDPLFDPLRKMPSFRILQADAERHSEQSNFRPR